VVPTHNTADQLGATSSGIAIKDTWAVFRIFGSAEENRRTTSKDDVRHWIAQQICNIRRIFP
jgi:hypothetical protein